MKNLGRLFGLLTAAVVSVAFALPASAGGSGDYGKKTISLSVTPVPAPLSSQTTAVSAIITNTGNSTADSFEIDWSTSPYFKVTSATAGGTAGNCSTATKGSGYSGCRFNKQLPTKTSVTVTLNVQVTNQCSAMSISWYAYAWTGSCGPSSQSFGFQGTPPVTSTTPNCSINFVTQPADAFVGSIITGSRLNSNGAIVTARLQNNGAAVVGTTVTLGAAPTSCANGASSATTDSSGNVVLAFTASGAGSCALTASAPGVASVNSQSFTVVQQQGNLGCDTSNNAFGTNVGELALNGTRLKNVDDADQSAPSCVVVPYIVSTTCPTGFTGACTNFAYDPLDQGTHMAFTFHWEWPLEAIPPGGIGAIQNTQQLFLNGNTTPLELDLCSEITPAFDANGTFTGLAAESMSPSDQDFTLVGTQAGCLVRRTVKQVGGQIQIVEDAYVQGDYQATRR